MQASELRIGNWINGIYHDYDDGINEDIENETICKVVTLDVSGSGDYPIYVYSDEDIEHFSDFKPIPLTEEWLLKLEFIKKNGYGFIKKDLAGNLFYSVETKEHFMFQYHNLRIKIKHVHQLQNLYFALTGEELTLKSE
jgi:hypothetical protein